MQPAVVEENLAEQVAEPFGPVPVRRIRIVTHLTSYSYILIRSPILSKLKQFYVGKY